MARIGRIATVVLVTLGMAACGGEEDGASSAGGAGGGAGTGGAGGAAGGVSGGTGGTSGGGGGGAGAGGAGGACAAGGPVGRCGDARPAGAPLPPPPPSYGGGTCPTLAPGINTITSSGAARQFILVVPSDHDGTEPLPLLFLWHWLGAEADDFLRKGEVQAAVDQMRFAAVIPEAKSTNLFKWPYSIIDSAAVQDEEAAFFDDMFACVSEQLPVDLDCVGSAGVSAGALWTDQLVGLRGQHLSSMMSLSGGVGGLIKPWVAPARKLPAFVLWGGPTDQCVTIQFQTTSQSLQSELTAGCHFQVECIHNCAHAEPPFVAPTGMSKYAALWRFFLDHPYWLGQGDSPWLRDGIPEGSPEWCGIGVGSATIREGECPPPSCPI